MEAKSFPRTPDPAKERARTRVRSLCQVCPGSAKCKGVRGHSEAGVFHLCLWPFGSNRELPDLATAPSAQDRSEVGGGRRPYQEPRSRRLLSVKEACGQEHGPSIEQVETRQEPAGHKKRWRPWACLQPPQE